MQKTRSLPLPPDYSCEENYVDSLLNFATSNLLFQKLCGGVHILDFMTQEPDLYSTLVPQEWRDWFEAQDIQNILDVLMREDLEDLRTCYRDRPSQGQGQMTDGSAQFTWRGRSSPPASLLDYVQNVRSLTLVRSSSSNISLSLSSPNKGHGLERNIAVGMTPKKMHEVGNFARYINELTHKIDSNAEHKITHIVDFGSGQNYLGRALASPLYRKNVIAIESKPHNIDGARTMDITAKLAKKEKIMRNKKVFRTGNGDGYGGSITKVANGSPESSCEPEESEQEPQKRHGSIQYVESLIHDGDLSTVVSHCRQSQALTSGCHDPQLLVISLHSCGNLLHHGLRSLVLNPSVKAVAMVGCCYNLVTERLGPPSYKLPSLRCSNQRVANASTACDPHGFPMSDHLATYEHEYGKGIRLNITARMMAVQAPQNWTPEDSEAFFTRHFYRALLQKLLVDRGVVGKPTCEGEEDVSSSPRGWSGAGQPIILGSLRKSCYLSFITYVRGAMEKLRGDSFQGPLIAKHMDDLTDEDITEYEAGFSSKKKELSVVWSLMAFSAGVVESIIVVDRWLYLREQEVVQECWVEPIFDYKQSPRNLVVVGIKK